MAKRARATARRPTDDLRRLVPLLFGEEMMIASRKDDVIARLITLVLSDDERVDWYRDWCAECHVDATRTDLERVKAGRARELNRNLLDD